VDLEENLQIFNNKRTGCSTTIRRTKYQAGVKVKFAIRCTSRTAELHNTLSAQFRTVSHKSATRTTSETYKGSVFGGRRQNEVYVCSTLPGGMSSHKQASLVSTRATHWK
jgi:hypothetical protein